MDQAEKNYKLAKNRLYEAESRLRKVMMAEDPPEGWMSCLWKTSLFVSASTLEARLEAKTRREEVHAELTKLLQFRFRIMADRDANAGARLDEARSKLNAAEALGDYLALRDCKATLLMAEEAVLRDQAAELENEMKEALEKVRPPIIW